MGAVFGELTGKGDGVTAGLKKVTNDMKSKNITAPVLEAKKPAASASSASSAAAKKPEIKREPKTYLSKGTKTKQIHCANVRVKASGRTKPGGR